MNQPVDLFEDAVLDPLDLHDILNPREVAVFSAVVDHRFGFRRANERQLLQLGLKSRVNVHSLSGDLSSSGCRLKHSINKPRANNTRRSPQDVTTR